MSNSYSSYGGTIFFIFLIGVIYIDINCTITLISNIIISSFGMFGGIFIIIIYLKGVISSSSDNKMILINNTFSDCYA